MQCGREDLEGDGRARQKEHGEVGDRADEAGLFAVRGEARDAHPYGHDGQECEEVAREDGERIAFRAPTEGEGGGCGHEEGRKAGDEALDEDLCGQEEARRCGRDLEALQDLLLAVVGQGEGHPHEGHRRNPYREPGADVAGYHGFIPLPDEGGDEKDDQGHDHPEEDHVRTAKGEGGFRFGEYQESSCLHVMLLQAGSRLRRGSSPGLVR